MLFGEYPYAIDDKGRVVMPVAFCEFVEDGVILTRGLEGCLSVFALSSWKRRAEQLEGLPLSDTSSRAFMRFFYSDAGKTRSDAQSRLLVPPLPSFAVLEGEVVVAGALGCLEL